MLKSIKNSDVYAWGKAAEHAGDSQSHISSEEREALSNVTNAGYVNQTTMNEKDFIKMPRVEENTGTMLTPGRFYVREFQSNCEDLPTSNDFYHIFEGMSQDGNYGTQLAIKMTGNATGYPEMFFRFKQNVWKAWMCVRSTYDGVCHTGGDFYLNGSAVGVKHTGYSDSAYIRMFVDSEGPTLEFNAIQGNIYHIDTLGGMLRGYTWIDGAYQPLFECNSDGSFDISGAANKAVRDIDGNIIGDTYMKKDCVNISYGGGMTTIEAKQYGALAIIEQHGNSRTGMLLNGSTIDPYNSVSPSTVPKISFGQSGRPWNGFYSYVSMTTVSDRRQKKDIREIDPVIAAQLVSKIIPITYQLKNGESGRTHYGMISQQVEEVINELGIDSVDFAPFIKSPVTEDIMEQATNDEGELLFDEDGSPTMIKVGEKETGEYTYMLRYEEFIPILWKKAQDETTRVNKLEEKVTQLTEENATLTSRIEHLEKLVTEFITKE